VEPGAASGSGSHSPPCTPACALPASASAGTPPSSTLLESSPCRCLQCPQLAPPLRSWSSFPCQCQTAHVLEPGKAQRGKQVDITGGELPSFLGHRTLIVNCVKGAVLVVRKWRGKGEGGRGADVHAFAFRPKVDRLDTWSDCRGKVPTQPPPPPPLARDCRQGGGALTPHKFYSGATAWDVHHGAS
jgi:hypothetical protein